MGISNTHGSITVGKKAILLSPSPPSIIIVYVLEVI
jgi:hypothetical protein